MTKIAASSVVRCRVFPAPSSFAASLMHSETSRGRSESVGRLPRIDIGKLQMADRAQQRGNPGRCRQNRQTPHMTMRSCVGLFTTVTTPGLICCHGLVRMRHYRHFAVCARKNDSGFAVTDKSKRSGITSSKLKLSSHERSLYRVLFGVRCGRLAEGRPAQAISWIGDFSSQR